MLYRFAFSTTHSTLPISLSLLQTRKRRTQFRIPPPKKKTSPISKLQPKSLPPPINNTFNHLSFSPTIFPANPFTSFPAHLTMCLWTEIKFHHCGCQKPRRVRDCRHFRRNDRCCEVASSHDHRLHHVYDVPCEECQDAIERQRREAERQAWIQSNARYEGVPKTWSGFSEG